MIHKHINEEFKYDGSQINPSWAFQEFSIKGSTIITWIGPMDVSMDNLKDFEDIGLNIQSDKSIHFIVEHFDSQPSNLELIYSRQRILIMIISQKLFEKGLMPFRNGDDIYLNCNNHYDVNDNFKPCKLTVSIATASISSMKIHVGINLTSKGTPDNVNTVGLLELDEFSNLDIESFIKDIVNSYISEIEDIKLDISKTKIYWDYS